MAGNTSSTRERCVLRGAVVRRGRAVVQLSTLSKLRRRSLVVFVAVPVALVVFVRRGKRASFEASESRVEDFAERHADRERIP